MLDNFSKYPPATAFDRPEKIVRTTGVLDKALHWSKGRILGLIPDRLRPLSRFVSRVSKAGKPLVGMADADLKAEVAELRMQLHRFGLRTDLVVRSFALVRETAFRTLSMRHYDCQIAGGRILLQGRVAEMETGEGKTLTATLAAATAAMAGIPVHVITVNDYLTQRDAELMEPVYRSLGLSVGCIIHGMAPAERKAAYTCHVTYCTNKEITFDYLRDWITLEGRFNAKRLQAESLFASESRTDRLLLRGLHFAIVDEADSILIDEARTPLIISRSTEVKEENEFLAQAVELAGRLTDGVHYRIDSRVRRIDLTAKGKKRIREFAKKNGYLWTGVVRREEVVRQALTALQLFSRDEQYVVIDGKVQIVDEFTGRVMPDRSYEGGLHQLIEIKEGCELSRRSETQARISYQRFFRRYLHLAGMTGTGSEVAGELWAVYGLQVVRVPTNRPVQRRRLPGSIFPSSEEKWAMVADRIRQENEKGRPVLVGTRSVAASEKAGRLLEDLGLKHRMLNAKQDKEEAEIVAGAGEAGSITIATNMAGRGTDIKLTSEVKKKKGLHVILTERHEAERIDRQLYGRCGRQGDPGSYEAILSMEDAIVQAETGMGLSFVGRILPAGSSAWRWWAMLAGRIAQKRTEKRHAGIRKMLLKEDERRGDVLSFSGRLE